MVIQGPESVTENYLTNLVFLIGTGETKPNFTPYNIKKNRPRGRRLHPVFGVIARPAWDTIAEPALP